MSKQRSQRLRQKRKLVSQESRLSSTPSQRPSSDDRDAWSAYWKAQGQPWRTEPEIDTKRQKELDQRRAIVPDIEKGIYPFKGMRLSRADVEWLLATHENGRGPVDWSDESQREREGLDLRGADLCHVDLSGLPLARVRCGLTFDEWRGATEEQRNMAMVLMKGANLSGAQLEGAILIKAQLEGAHFRWRNSREPTSAGRNSREPSSPGRSSRMPASARRSSREPTSAMKSMSVLNSPTYNGET